jgi:plasmid stability protein
MFNMLQVQKVPDALHCRLRMRAASRGLALTDYVLQMLKRADREPSIDEWLEEVRKLPATRLTTSPSELIRKAQDSRSSFRMPPR